MKRDKAWWGRLTEDERWSLWHYEHDSAGVGCAYLPEDCYECSGCGNPSMSGMCKQCSDDFQRILDKANGVKR